MKPRDGRFASRGLNLHFVDWRDAAAPPTEDGRIQAFRTPSVALLAGVGTGSSIIA